VVGTNAAKIALGMGAHVTMIDKQSESPAPTRRYFQRPHRHAGVQHLHHQRHAEAADLVVGGVLVPGASAPKLVRRDMISMMKPGAVVVDVAIDQGGCFETSRATTHTEPIYFVDERAALLRLEHARRRAAHFHLRAHQRHFPLPDGTRQQGPGKAPAPSTRRCAKASTPTTASSRMPRVAESQGRQYREPG
jgi:hypothetical protein